MTWQDDCARHVAAAAPAQPGLPARGDFMAVLLGDRSG